MSIFRLLWLVIAGATQKKLARQVRYLKTENEVLRSKLPARITITPKERQRLLKFGSKLGKALRQLVTIVCYETFLRWIREDKRSKRKNKLSKPSKRGRPRTQEEILALIVLLAKENNWGYDRIGGELRKLNIFSVTKSTVKNILKAGGLDPCPKHAGGTWNEFFERNAARLWQCDFFAQKILTVKGIRTVYLLAFLHVQTRRVNLSAATEHPTEAWVTEQAGNFVKQARSDGLRVSYVQRDRDGKYADFDDVLQRHHAKAIKGAVRYPNARAFVERFIGTIRRECLDHFVFFGTKHLQSVTKTWLEFYHRHRPHQGRENKLLIKPKVKRRKKKATTIEGTISLADIRCEQQLGGRLKSDSRKAA